MHSTSAAQSGSRALLNWYRNEEDETVAEFGEELKADFRAIEFTDRLGCWSRTISARESSSIASMVGSSDLFASDDAAATAYRESLAELIGHFERLLRKPGARSAAATASNAKCRHSRND